MKYILKNPDDYAAFTKCTGMDSWNRKIRAMRCAEHDESPGFHFSGKNSFTGATEFSGEFDVCCEAFAEQVMEKCRAIAPSLNNQQFAFLNF